MARVCDQHSSGRTPLLSSGHEDPAYVLKFYGEGDDALLLSSRDDGRIQVWQWKEISDAFRNGVQCGRSPLQPVIEMKNPQKRGPGVLHEDDLLQVGELYFLLPNQRLQFVLTHFDMASMLLKANGAIEKRKKKLREKFSHCSIFICRKRIQLRLFVVCQRLHQEQLRVGNRGDNISWG
ncbi:hypothetical protein KI387_000525 [Taxus chinensis]|uniref:Uncharacterized protein n=1 Tax=Taxus chinensis TaxID=29808 RepID=A0AA38LP49_TAXCH|nr:hypothetical protein KI387_000525 [Taxus chinensis]